MELKLFTFSIFFGLFASSPSNSDSESDIIVDNGDGSISQVSVYVT